MSGPTATPLPGTPTGQPAVQVNPIVNPPMIPSLAPASTGTTTTLSTGTTKTAPIKPVDPIMSTYNESYKGAADWYAISGGKPKADWSGLDTSVPRQAPNPKQDRPAKSDAKQKAYTLRIVGLTVPFKEGHSLRDFREDILDHLNKNGLDTITFLPDVADRQVMRSIITEHPKFTTSLLESIKIAKDISLKYDAFDLNNSVAATEFLFASLDTELTRRVKRLMEPGDTFAAVWLRLIDVLVSISSRHHDDIREKVRRCSPTDYAHENLEAMIDDIKVSFEDLICANQFDVALLYTFLNNISEKCTQTGIFKHNLFGKMQDVSNELRQCAFMSRDNALDHMTSKSLDPESIFKFLRSEYQVLSKDNLWTPSQRRVDSSKVSASVIHTSIQRVILVPGRARELKGAF